MELEIRNYRELLERVLSETSTPPGSPVAGGGPNEAQGAVEEAREASDTGICAREDELDIQVTERPVYLRVWDHPMSPGTRFRLLEKSRRLEHKRGARGSKHHNTRRRKRREKYWKYQRAGKLRRDKWLTSCPEGLYLYYKRIAKRRKAAWEFTKEQFVELMNSTYKGVALYEYVFNLVRLDKKLGYNISNITIVDRYTKEVLYTNTSN